MIYNPQQSGDKTEQPQPFVTPAIPLPKGGGAIRGMGEKFAANPVTGTGSMTVPIATSPGRSGFGPQLALSYDSGAGNGPFGFGWNLSLPAITRKTDKGLPQYRDAEESDVFILSGAEDRVPVYRQDPAGSWVASHPGYQRDTNEFWVRYPDGRLVVHENDLDGFRPRFPTQTQLDEAGWMLTVVFDYGEHAAADSKPDDSGDWLCRQDLFSSYRLDFDPRTNRLYWRRPMFQHFPDEAGVSQDCRCVRRHSTIGKGPSPRSSPPSPNGAVSELKAGLSPAIPWPPLKFQYSQKFLRSRLESGLIGLKTG